VGERSYLAIGDVLALLREEFPDVTISKIRFLESRGLLVPERTPSGYRKFYEPDVDRLRWILRQQREHFLPLKVIKGRLENGMSDPTTPAPPLFEMGDPPPERAPEPVLVGAPVTEQASEAAGAALAPLTPIGVVAPSAIGVAGRGDAPPPANGETTPRGAHAPRATAEPSPREEASSGRQRPSRPEVTTEPAVALAAPAAGEAQPAKRQRRHNAPSEPTTGQQTGVGEQPQPGEGGRPGPQPEAKPGARGSARSTGGLPGGGASGATLTATELASASGLDIEGVEELESFGLIAGRLVAGVPCYDEEAVLVAKLAARFAPYGIEARHLRIFKHAADRQTGLFAQVITPLLRQRNPEARARALEDLSELSELGEALMRCFSQAILRELTGG
jgi:DNA-binding transcriptional MerR regulator